MGMCGRSPAVLGDRSRHNKDPAAEGQQENSNKSFRRIFYCGASLRKSKPLQQGPDRALSTKGSSGQSVESKQALERGRIAHLRASVKRSSAAPARVLSDTVQAPQQQNATVIKVLLGKQLDHVQA